MLEKQEENCCGCTACMQACPKDAITMWENQKGFLMPMVDPEKCIQCGICRQVCRFEGQVGNPLPESSLEVYGIKKKHGRLQSQSGGAFAAFAEHMLLQGGTVYGVAARGKNIFYTRICSMKELPSLKGSKYVQASVGNVFMEVKKDLEDGRNVLFSGTPCHVDGLYAFLRQKKVDVRPLITCDVVCHGVPSPKIFCDYYDYLKRRFGMVHDFNFRKKFVGGWHAHIESFMTSSNKLITSINYRNIFYSHLELRESCYRCPYTSINRSADITVGDFWGIEKTDLLYDDGDGVSLVLVRSQKGKQFFKEILSNVKSQQYQVKDCLQPNLQHPTEKPSDYNAFWKMYQECGFDETVKKYCGFSEGDYTEETFLRNIKRKIRRKGRIVKRILRRLPGV